MGRVAKGVKCSVTGCDRQAVRSLSTEKVSSAKLKMDVVRRVYLCKDHYKEYRRNPAIKKQKTVTQFKKYIVIAAFAKIIPV